MILLQSSVPKPHGQIIISDPERPLDEVHDTLQCCHCGYHWQVVKGSKRVRGFCHKCAAPHCGKPSCWECHPYKKFVEEGR